MSVSPHTWLEAITKDSSVCLPRGAVKVAQALATFAIEHEIPVTCTLFPGRERLCELTGLAYGSVKRNLAILIEHGLLERVSRGVSRGHDGKPRRSHYRLLLPSASIQGLTEPLSTEPLKVLNPPPAELADQPTAPERPTIKVGALSQRVPAENVIVGPWLGSGEERGPLKHFGEVAEDADALVARALQDAWPHPLGEIHPPDAWEALKASQLSDRKARA